MGKEQRPALTRRAQRAIARARESYPGLSITAQYEFDGSWSFTWEADGEEGGDDLTPLDLPEDWWPFDAPPAMVTEADMEEAGFEIA